VILADSSVLIEFQRIPSLRTRQIIAKHDAAICGVTVVELLTGARNSAERQRVATLLSAFKRLPVDEPAWELAGDLAAGLRVRGMSLALADVVIAATAVHHGLPLWTRDNHFARLQALAPLALFDESTA
jgi:predicted nucleic acid-binding protein